MSFPSKHWAINFSNYLHRILSSVPFRIYKFFDTKNVLIEIVPKKFDFFKTVPWYLRHENSINFGTKVPLLPTLVWTASRQNFLYVCYCSRVWTLAVALTYVTANAETNYVSSLLQNCYWEFIVYFVYFISLSFDV